jgi:hypothetical protein
MGRPRVFGRPIDSSRSRTRDFLPRETERRLEPTKRHPACIPRREAPAVLPVLELPLRCRNRRSGFTFEKDERLVIHFELLSEQGEEAVAFPSRVPHLPHDVPRIPRAEPAGHHPGMACLPPVGFGRIQRKSPLGLGPPFGLSAARAGHHPPVHSRHSSVRMVVCASDTLQQVHISPTFTSSLAIRSQGEPVGAFPSTRPARRARGGRRFLIGVYMAASFRVFRTSCGNDSGQVGSGFAQPGASLEGVASGVATTARLGRSSLIWVYPSDPPALSGSRKELPGHSVPNHWARHSRGTPSSGPRHRPGGDPASRASPHALPPSRPGYRTPAAPSVAAWWRRRKHCGWNARGLPLESVDRRFGARVHS